MNPDNPSSSGLKSIKLPNSLVLIGDGALLGCGLREIELPQTVMEIQEYAFKGNQLRYVSIPKSVQRIGKCAFIDNPNLMVINLEGRDNTEDMILGENWNGTAKVVFNQSSPPPMENGDTANIELAGTIEPVTSLNLDVPVQTTFHIDANRDFIAPEFEIINHSAAPVSVTAVSLKAKSGTSAKVIAEDAYTDEQWNNLSAADTQSKIALGLRVQESSSLTSALPAGSLWFGDESGDSNLELGSIQSAYGLEQPPKLVLQYDARYGKQWGDVSSLSYELILCFETA